MKKASEVFKKIRFAKMDPGHEKAGPFSTDDEEHYTISTKEWEQQVKHVKKRAMQEDLRKWFDKDHPEGGWKRINSKGEAIGPCAREPGEPKPKCMSNEKRAQLSKKERASAVATKRKHDPNPERKGEPINVSNFGKGKISEDMENLEEKNVPTSPEKWAQAKSQAKAKFDVYPSAYANGWASKKYKAMGGGWKSVDEAVKDKFDIGEYDQEGDMAKSDLRSIIANAQKMHDMIDDADNLPEWVQSKITKAEDYISTVANYMTSEMSEEVTTSKPKTDHDKWKQEYKKARDAGSSSSNAKARANGAVYEEVEQVEEGMMKRMATDKEEDNRMSKVPFEGPYTKVKNTVTDKSGAKHSPMSRARDLARTAMKKQADKMKVPVKKDLKESRKSEIVKEIMKKKKDPKDKFEPNPTLTSQVQKIDNAVT